MPRASTAIRLGACELTNDYVTPEIDTLSRALSGVVPAIVLLVVLSLALAPFRDRLNTGTIALVLLLPVLVSTVGGVWVALTWRRSAPLTFNFFFTCRTTRFGSSRARAS